jgi:hypothetical protein
MPRDRLVDQPAEHHVAGQRQGERAGHPRNLPTRIPVG